MLTDYASSGLTLQAAFLTARKRGEFDRGGPAKLLWNGDVVLNADHLDVPKLGWVTLTILDDKFGGVRQAVDIKAESGWIELGDGSRVETLRTWSDPTLEESVTYRYSSKSGRLIVWNTYRMEYAGGQTVEERWTGNAGLTVKALDDRRRRYGASPGFAKQPDFEGLVFEVSVSDEV